MKNILIAFILFLFLTTMSQAQPLPPDEFNSSTDEAPAGGGAPVGEGTALLVALGSLYAVKKKRSIEKL